MQTVSQAVAHLIEKSPFIQETLNSGLINGSSLARYLQPEVSQLLDKDIQVGAILMAIKRLPQTEYVRLEKSLSSFMKQLGDIIVRSDLVEYSYRNSDTLLGNQAQLLQNIDQSANQFCSFCRGVHETTIIVSKALVSQVDVFFKNEKEIIVRSQLAAVTLMLPSNNLDTYGVYYSILKRLAWQGINLIEVVSTAHEITLVVSKDDVDAVFSLVMDMKR